MDVYIAFQGPFSKWFFKTKSYFASSSVTSKNNPLLCVPDGPVMDGLILLKAKQHLLYGTKYLYYFPAAFPTQQQFIQL